jgi:hypothetical protein
MTALYAFAAAVSAVFEEIEDANGEITPEVEAVLDAATGSFVAKTDAVVAYIRQLEADAASARGEASFFQEKARRAEAQAQRLRDYALSCLVKAQLPEVRTERFRVAVRKNPVSVQVDVDATALPETYRRTKTEVSPDKGAIKEALQAGTLVPGCRLVQTVRVDIK